MTGFKILRQAIIDKINTTVQALEAKNRKVGTAVWSPADVENMPAVIVLPEELDSSYHDTGDTRRRVFIFRVYILEELGNRNQTGVEKELSDGIDFLIDLFDRKVPITGISDLLHIRPVPSVWGNVTWGGGEARVATMTLQCDIIAEN